MKLFAKPAAFALLALLASATLASDTRMADRDGMHAVYVSSSAKSAASEPVPFELVITVKKSAP